MVHSTEILSRDDAQIGFVLLIDGLPSGFSTHPDLTGDYINSITGVWDGNITASLDPSFSLPWSINLSRAPLLENESTVFTLKDVDGELVDLFSSETTVNQELFTTLYPNDSALNAITVDGSPVTQMRRARQFWGLSEDGLTSELASDITGQDDFTTASFGIWLTETDATRFVASQGMRMRARLDLKDDDQGYIFARNAADTTVRMGIRLSSGTLQPVINHATTNATALHSIGSENNRYQIRWDMYPALTGVFSSRIRVRNETTDVDQTIEFDHAEPTGLGGDADVLFGARHPTIHTNEHIDQIFYEAFYATYAGRSWIGHEAIGPQGQRHKFPCFITASQGAVTASNWGDFHLGANLGLGEPVSYVTDKPILHNGRRFALYRVPRDDDGNYRPLEECDLAYYGTFRDVGGIRERDWKIRVDGPWSLTAKRLTGDHWAEPVSIQASSSLPESQRRFGCQFFMFSSGSDGTKQFKMGHDIYETLIGSENPRQDFADAAQNVADNVIGPELSAPYTEYYEDNFFNVHPGTCAIDIAVRTDAPDFYMGQVKISLHLNQWRILGFDPIEQPFHSLDEKTYIYFDRDDSERFWVTGTGDWQRIDAPEPGYYTAWLTTKPLGSEMGSEFTLIAGDAVDEMDNGGAPRTYLAASTNPVFFLDPTLGDGAGQVIWLQSGFELLHAHGQQWLPVASDPTDPTQAFDLPEVGRCNRTGLFIIHGPMRFSGEENPRTVYQIAKCSWRATDITEEIEQDSSGRSPLVIERFLFPRMYGFQNDKLSDYWAGTSNINPEDRIRIQPFTGFKYRLDDDRIELELMRLFLNSGTGNGWDSYFDDDDSSLAAGINNKVSSLFPNQVLDGERHGMGFNIPAELVANARYWHDAFEHVGSDHKWINLSRVGTVELREAIDQMMVSRGVAMGWQNRNGRPAFVPFQYSRVPSLADEGLVSLGVEDTVGSTWLNIDIRVIDPPRDTGTLKYQQNPLDLDYAREHDFRSWDAGARLRTGTSHVDSEDPGSWHVDQAVSWANTWQHLSRFFERRHFVATVPVNRKVARELFPGVKVRMTHPALISQLGTYGITNFVGLCLSKNERIKGGSHENVVELLFYAEQASQKFYAPLGYVHSVDYSTNRLYLWDDGSDSGSTGIDALRFREFEASDIGGSAEVTIWQYDGRNWSGINATIVSISEEGADTSYIEVDSTSGLYRDTMKRVTFRAYPGQDANNYVSAFYAPTNAKDGTHYGEPGDDWRD